MSDLTLDEAQDYDIESVDTMPQYVSEIDGIYKCSLSLSRETEPRNDKPQDNLVFTFTIQEIIEERKNHGVNVEDMVGLRFSLLLSDKDRQNGNKDSFGLRLAKPFLLSLKNSLGCTGNLNTIVNESQDVSCTATFSTRYSKAEVDGKAVVYANPTLKKLIID